MKRDLGFIIFLTVFTVVITAVNFYVLNRILSFALLISFTLAVSFPLFTMLVRVYPNQLLRALYYISSLIFGTLIVFFGVLVLSDIIGIFYHINISVASFAVEARQYGLSDYNVEGNAVVTYWVKENGQPVAGVPVEVINVCHHDSKRF